MDRDSKEILDFFINKDNINYSHHDKINKKVIPIFKQLFAELQEGQQKMEFLLKNTQVSKRTVLEQSFQISKPATFNQDTFPAPIMKHINEFSIVEYLYTFSLFQRTIKVYFILEKDEDVANLQKYMRQIMLWMYLMHLHTSPGCSKTMSVFFYMTSLKKTLPQSKEEAIDWVHANTGFTRTCIANSEIIIFRKEEWFKVFLHESFHNFSLDFSDMNVDKVNSQIRQLFPVKSEVTLYEVYTEFWAEIMNTVICSFMMHPHNESDYLKACDFFINCERHFGMYQLVKVLKHMGLTYSDIKKDYISESKREKREIKETSQKVDVRKQYKESTNVLSYYVLKNILLNNYNGFLEWCLKYNKKDNVFQFVKSEQNLQLFFQFIFENYGSSSMMKAVKHAEQLQKTGSTLDDEFVCNSMRMTCLQY